MNNIGNSTTACGMVTNSIVRKALRAEATRDVLKA